MRRVVLLGMLSVLLVFGAANAATSVNLSCDGADGYIIDMVPRSVNGTGVNINFGDYANNKGSRGFFSFSPGGLADVYVYSADLYFYRYACSGDPWANLGDLEFYYFTTPYGDPLPADGSPYDSADAVYFTSLSGLCCGAGCFGWLNVDVTAQVQDAIDNGLSNIQFRVQHAVATDNDDQNDYDQVRSCDWATASQRPYIALSYDPVGQVDVIVNGPGKVNAPPDEVGDGIDCPCDCSGRYILGHNVVLTAMPDPGFVFAGWSGGPCDGSTNPTCEVTALDTPVEITATFTEPPIPTLNQWGLGILCLLTAISAIVAIRRKTRGVAR